MEHTLRKAQGSIKILMVDDQKLVLIGMAKVVAGLNPKYIVGTASSAIEAIKIVREHKPNIVFIDIEMPDIDGIEATRRIKRIAPDTKVIALTVQTEYPLPKAMIEAGAICYLSKDVDEPEIQQAIIMACNNSEYISMDVAQNMALHSFSKWAVSPFTMLSARELQIAYMVFHSMTVRAIANHLSLSPKTVNSYRYRIFSKLQINNDMQLALLAVKFRLLDVFKSRIGENEANSQPDLAGVLHEPSGDGQSIDKANDEPRGDDSDS